MRSGAFSLGGAQTSCEIVDQEERKVLERIVVDLADRRSRLARDLPLEGLEQASNRDLRVHPIIGVDRDPEFALAEADEELALRHRTPRIGNP